MSKTMLLLSNQKRTVRTHRELSIQNSAINITFCIEANSGDTSVAAASSESRLLPVSSVATDSDVGPSLYVLSSQTRSDNMSVVSNSSFHNLNTTDIADSKTDLLRMLSLHFESQHTNSATITLEGGPFMNDLLTKIVFDKVLSNEKIELFVAIKMREVDGLQVQASR